MSVLGSWTLLLGTRSGRGRYPRRRPTRSRSLGAPIASVVTMKAVVSSRGASAAASRYRIERLRSSGGRIRPAPDRYRPQIVQPEFEPGDDAEVAAATTDRPEQIRLFIRVDARESAVCHDDVGFDETVDREPEAPAEVAHAASERQAPDPRVRHHASRCRPGRSGRPPRRRRRAARPRRRRPFWSVDRRPRRSSVTGRRRCRRRRCRDPRSCGRRSARRAAAWNLRRCARPSGHRSPSRPARSHLGSVR